MQRSCQFVFTGKICPKKLSSVWHCFYSVFYCFPIFIRYFLKISYVMRIFSWYKSFFHYWWRSMIESPFKRPVGYRSKKDYRAANFDAGKRLFCNIFTNKYCLEHVWTAASDLSSLVFGKFLTRIIFCTIHIVAMFRFLQHFGIYSFQIDYRILYKLGAYLEPYQTFKMELFGEKTAAADLFSEDHTIIAV